MLFQFYSVTLQHLLFILHPWQILGVLGSFTTLSIYDSSKDGPHGPNLAFTFITHLNTGKQR